MEKQEYQPFLSGFVPEFVYYPTDSENTTFPSKLGSTTAICVLEQMDSKIPLCVEQIAQFFRIVKISYSQLLPGRLGSLIPLPGNNGHYYHAIISRDRYEPNFEEETLTLAHEIGHIALWDSKYALKHEDVEDFSEAFAKRIVRYCKRSL